jgi:hypothetical protein
MSVKVHKITNLYNGKIFDIVLEKVTLPNGATKNREVVRHPGAAAMVPLLDDGGVVLIRQYRHAVGEFLWEIPAGNWWKRQAMRPHALISLQKSCPPPDTPMNISTSFWSPG